MSLYPPLPSAPPLPEDGAQHSLLPVCPVCLEDFREDRLPKYLSCHHTVCLACVGQLAGQVAKVVVECPLCRHPTPVSASAMLPTNHTILTMAKYGHVFANLWCRDCQKPATSSCGEHRLVNRAASANATLGQQVDEVVEQWSPTVTKVVETTSGWTVLAADATYSALRTFGEYVAPVASYLAEWVTYAMEAVQGGQQRT